MSLEKKVKRFDRATLGKAIRLDNGFMRVPAKLTRTGVFEYDAPGGKIVRELRLPEEVFKQVSLDSFYLKPVVDDHPTENNGVVDSTNVRRLSVGTVGTVTRDGKFVVADLMIVDSRANEKVEAGKRELSCGYFCDREPAEPGATWQDPESGESTPYDYIQRNITGNHVAIVARGRAGPEARISLDAAGDALQFDSQTQTGVQPQKETMKFTIHGVEFEVSTEIASAIAAERAINADTLTAVKAETVKLKSDADKAQAVTDSKSAEVTKLTADLASARDPKTLSAAVAERVALESKAVVVLGTETKLDAMSNQEIKIAVVAKSNPALKLDGKSADYINCAFDLVDAKSAAPVENPLTVAARKAIASTPEVKADGKPMTKADHHKAIFSIDASEVKPARF